MFFIICKKSLTPREPKRLPFVDAFLKAFNNSELDSAPFRNAAVPQDSPRAPLFSSESRVPRLRAAVKRRERRASRILWLHMEIPRAVNSVRAESGMIFIARGVENARGKERFAEYTRSTLVDLTCGVTRPVKEWPPCVYFPFFQKNNRRYADVSFQCSINVDSKSRGEKTSGRAAINNAAAEFRRRGLFALAWQYRVNDFRSSDRRTDVFRARIGERTVSRNFWRSNLHPSIRARALARAHRSVREKRIEKRNARGPERLNFTVRGSET